MNIDENEIISAQVILPSANGRRPDGRTAITSANIKDFRPTIETVEEATKAFTKAGFDVGPTVGNSFSITARAAIFIRFFRICLQRTASGGIQAISDDGSISEGIPIGGLPESITKYIIGVTFVPPPNFGSAGTF
jgi:hypothetical protein